MTRAGGEIIEIARIKANYAPPQDKPVLVRWVEGYIAPIPAAELRAGEERQLVERLAALPAEEWMGITALAAHWECPLPVARRAVIAMQGNTPGLEHRQRGHGVSQWKVQI